MPFFIHFLVYDVEKEVQEMAAKKDETTGKWMYYGSYKLNGKTKQYKKRGFGKKKDAIKAEIIFKENLKEPNATIIFNELSYQYQVYSEKRIKESSYLTQRAILKLWEDRLGDCEIRKITTNEIESVINELLESMSFSTMVNCYAKFRAVLNYAVRQVYIQVNPCNKIDLKKDPNEKKKEMKYWTVEQFNKFIVNEEKEVFHLLFTNQFYMGMRIGEALALQWKDVDLINNTIKISKTWSNALRKATTPKTNNSYRTITMPQFLVDEYKTFKEKIHANADDYIFGTTLPFYVNRVQDELKRVIRITNIKLQKDEQIPIIRTHDLRHSCASYMINNMVTNGIVNFSVYDIAKRLGDNLDTVLSVYAHWLPQADKGIVKFMEKDKF
jgi:integrase